MRCVSAPRRRPGYALVAVLIVVVVLSLAAYRFTDAMTAEYQVAVRSSEAAQVKTFAASGIHYATGALADPDTLNNRLAGNPYDNPTEFANIALGATDDPRAGRFSLIAVADTGTGSGVERYQIRYGVLDESAKLNINSFLQIDSSGQRLHDALMKLPNMTEEIADAIVDWVDPDDTPRPAGAESAYYQGLPGGYLAKNGPLSSIEELLLVRGVTPYLLFGNDRNRNGRLDPGEEDGTEFSRGWSEFLTCYGRELNVDSTGQPRVNLTQQDLNTLATELTDMGLDQYLVDYLLAARLYGTSSVSQSGQSQQRSQGNSNRTPTVQGGASELRAAVSQSLSSGGRARGRLNSVASLINTQVTLPRAQNAPANTPTVVVPSPLNDPAKRRELLPILLDKTTARSAFEIFPRVNVNTAPPEVLAALPGLEPADVDAILAARPVLDPSDLATTTAAWLLTEANLTPDKFRRIENYVTGQTMTYRVHSVGYFGQGGSVARMEAVIDTNQGHPRIVYFRDLSDLGKGFDLPR